MSHKCERCKDLTDEKWFKCECGSYYCPKCAEKEVRICSQGCTPECDSCAYGTSQEFPDICFICKKYFCRRCVYYHNPFICTDCKKITFPLDRCTYTFSQGPRKGVKCGNPSSHILGRCKKHLTN